MPCQWRGPLAACTVSEEGSISAVRFSCNELNRMCVSLSVRMKSIPHRSANDSFLMHALVVPQLVFSGQVKTSWLWVKDATTPLQTSLRELPFRTKSLEHWRLLNIDFLDQPSLYPYQPRQTPGPTIRPPFHHCGLIRGRDSPYRRHSTSSFKLSDHLPASAALFVFHFFSKEVDSTTAVGNCRAPLPVIPNVAI